MCHHIKRSRGCETSLILIGGVPARSHHLSVLLVESRRCPAVVVVLGREDVVERDAEGQILHAQLLRLEGIAQIDIGVEVSVEHHAYIRCLAIVVEGLIALETCVRQILLPHVLTLDAGSQSTIVEGEDIIEDGTGRER